MELPLQFAAEVQRNVLAALVEDIGGGDLTALLTPAARRSQGSVISREAAVLAGTSWFDACFRLLDPLAAIRWHARDGDLVAAGQTLCEIVANTRALLTAERAALNFLQLLSATATATRFYVEAVAGTGACIVDTRKTLPGLRLAQKYAVATGGGHNQRIGLFDGILLKENHIIAAGGIRPALRAAQQAAAGLPVQIEVETLQQLQTALDAGARLILLDNFSPQQLRAAVGLAAGRACLEASGNISLDNVREVALTGVERISIGALTKHVRAVDLSMRFSLASC